MTSATNRKTDLTAMLDGFEFMTSTRPPALTLDRQYRLFVNVAARELFDIKPYDRLALAYNAAKNEIAIVKADDIGNADKRLQADLRSSSFTLDKRYYLHVTRYFKSIGIKALDEPYRFEYMRGASDGSVFIFRLVDDYK